MTVDPGFTDAIRRHVEEHGSLIVRLAEVAEPGLWGPQLAGQWTPTRLREARERSTAQAREFLSRACEPPAEGMVDRRELESAFDRIGGLPDRNSESPEAFCERVEATDAHRIAFDVASILTEDA